MLLGGADQELQSGLHAGLLGRGSLDGGETVNLGLQLCRRSREVGRSRGVGELRELAGDGGEFGSQCGALCKARFCIREQLTVLR